MVGITLAIFGSIGFGRLGLFDWIAVPLYAMLLVFILTRFGVLALIVAFTVAALSHFSLTADFSTWYAGSSLFAIAFVLVLTAYASYTALAGRRPFKAEFLDSD